MTAALIDNSRTAIGGNHPPSDAAILRDHLNTAYADLGKRADELLAGVARVPGAIENDETEKKAIEFVKQLTAHVKLSDSTRTTAKAPHFEAVKIVDGWFKNIIDPLTNGKNAVLAKLTDYQTKKAAIAKAAAEEAERIARAAAAEAAAKIETDADLTDAIVKQEQADQASVAASATPADLSRTRGVYGSVGSLRTTIDFEIVDLEQVPRTYLMVNEAAVKAAIKAGKRNSDIPGVRIFEKKTTVVR